MSAGRLFNRLDRRSSFMSDDLEQEVQPHQPKKITRKEADRLNNFAQDLNDEITHVVDYGALDDEDSKKK